MDRYYGYHGNPNNFTVSSQKAFGLRIQSKDTRGKEEKKKKKKKTLYNTVFKAGS